MKKFALILFLLTAAAIAAARPIELEDLFRLKRVSDPQLSPDGTQVVYVVTEVLKDENRLQSDLWLVSANGGEAHRLTSSPKHERHPRWSPDGKWIAFESNREGTFQIWVLPAPSAGSGQAPAGEARRITNLSTEATQPVWAPTGDKIAFVSAVFPQFSDKPFAEADKANKDEADRREKSKVKARVATQLLYRHWDAWVDGKRQHVFVMPVKAGDAAGEPRDVTPGDNDAIPTSSTFSAGDDYAFSPDGKELAYTAPNANTREQAWTTNHDIWTIDLASGERRQVTTSAAADTFPRYSPDGKFLAYRAQARAGFEADRWQLRVRSRTSGEDWSLTGEFDASVEDFSWARDGKTLTFPAQDAGKESLWAVDAAGGAVRKLAGGGVNIAPVLSADNRFVVYVHSSFTEPQEVWRADLVTKRAPIQLTHTNADLVKDIQMAAPESVTVKGPRSTGSGQASGADVQMWVIKPPGFDASKKHPLVFWVHGGPQGAFMDSWSARWNPQVWASQGYVVALPNPRGSTGFGQKFTDEISRDWGGKVFEDLMAALGHLEKQPWIDTTRMAAAGASYGGYMMNWFQGHTDKFRTIVTHCGVYNLESMYGTTEETWFAEWDTGVPWKNAEELRQWSPHTYAANFKTPNLIIHNELDFRVPINQGMELFTALQRQGVPSKLVMFPDEGHWVNKPQNSERWHQEIFHWLAEYLKN